METARKYTSADLLLMPDDGNRYEIIEGDLYVSKLPSAEHQFVCTRICRFLDTTLSHHATGALRKLMFTGVQILEPKVFDYMDVAVAPQKFSTTKQTYPRMLADRQPLYGFHFEGFWQDLGTAERIRYAEQSLARGTVKLHYL